MCERAPSGEGGQGERQSRGRGRGGETSSSQEAVKGASAVQVCRVPILLQQEPVGSGGYCVTPAAVRSDCSRCDTVSGCNTGSWIQGTPLPAGKLQRAGAVEVETYGMPLCFTAGRSVSCTGESKPGMPVVNDTQNVTDAGAATDPASVNMQRISSRAGERLPLVPSWYKAETTYAYCFLPAVLTAPLRPPPSPPATPPPPPHTHTSAAP